MVRKTDFGYLAIAFWIVLSVGCNTPPDPKYFKNGKQYGIVQGLFRERWWNFYERGSSFAEGEFWKESVSDFKEALKLRDKDQRRARTYGIHFEDYFPHRDLGVAYYHLGNYEDAKKELEISLAQIETAKAKFYLNKVRKALLEASKADTAPPIIHVDQTLEDDVTNNFTMQLKGEVEDDTYAQEIAINEDQLFIELSAKKITFSKEIKLKKGFNEITLKTSDLLGKVTEKKISMFADFEGPLVLCNNYVDGQEVSENNIVLQGTLADATGITTLCINNQIFTYHKERKIAFTFTVDLSEGNNRIALSATDVAGNTTTGELNLVYTPKISQSKPLPKSFSKNSCPKQNLIKLVLNGSGMLDTGHHRLFAATMPVQMGSALQLKLKDLSDTQTVYYDKIFIDGSVVGVNDITAVTINNTPLFIIPGRTIFFNQLLELREGENKLTIDVRDSKGNTASKTITIMRELPKVHEIGSRISLAIMPFVAKGQVSPASEMLYDNLVSAFFNQKRFNIVSRGAELEAVLRELKLSETDLVDKSKAVKVGKLVAAEWILMGTIHETKNAIEIYARLVNTETSTLLEAKDVYGQDKSLGQLQYLTDGLALKFKHSFPLIEGLVIKVSAKNIYADFGSVQQIKKEMKFIVFREGAAILHPLTGKALGRETEELGIATVVNVFEDMSIGKLIADFDPRQIQVKDKIITK